MKIYGPVPSWRLKNSLGIDTIDPKEGTTKSCTFDCIYCHLGHGKKHITEPTRIQITDHDLETIRKKVQETRPDHITFSGTCEPTLNLELGAIAEKIKTFTTTPIALLTNSSLLKIPEIKENAEKCDKVFAKLDAPDQELFGKINNPKEGIMLKDIIESIKTLNTRTYIQTLLFKSSTITNADDRTIDKLIEIYQEINEKNPIEICLGTITRPTDTSGLEPIPESRLKEIADKIKEQTGIETHYYTENHKTPVKRKITEDDLETELLNLLKRRPCTPSEIESRFKGTDTRQEIEKLIEKKIIKKEPLKKQTFYVIRQ